VQEIRLTGTLVGGSDYRLAVCVHRWPALVLLVWAALWATGGGDGAGLNDPATGFRWPACWRSDGVVLCLGFDAPWRGLRARAVLAQLALTGGLRPGFWVDLNEESPTSPPWRRPAADGCAPALGLSVLGCWGRRLKAPPPSVCCGGNWMSRLPGLAGGTLPDGSSPLVARVFAFVLRGRSHCDPHGVHRLCWALAGGVVCLQVAAGALPRQGPGAGEF